MGWGSIRVNIWRSVNNWTINCTNMRRIFEEVTNELLEDMRRIGFYRQGELCRDATPWDINNGLCEEWAYMVSDRIGSEVEIWETDFDGCDTHHIFIRVGGRFYDAECHEGVVNYMELPIFRGLRQQPILLVDHSCEVAPDVNAIGF